MANELPQVESLRDNEIELLSKLIEMQIRSAAREISIKRGYDVDDKKRQAILLQCYEFVGGYYST